MSSIEQTVREIVELIARGECEAVAKMTGGARMSADDLREAVDEYGYELSSPGSGWWDMVHVMGEDGYEVEVQGLHVQ